MSAFRWLAVFALGLSLVTGAQARCPDETASLSAACADLVHALDRAGLVSRLDLNLDQAADPRTVAMLRAWLSPPPQAEQSRPDRAQLERVIADNYQLELAKETGLWGRLTQWWEALFDEPDKAPYTPSKFWPNLVPSQALARVLFYGISGLLLGLLVLYSWREVRPLLAARRSAQRIARANAKGLAQSWPPELTDLDPRNKLARLYKALVELLTARGELPPVPGLTHHELSHAHAPADPRFSQLSAGAALSLFAGHEPTASELAAYLQHASGLARQPSTSGKLGNA